MFLPLNLMSRYHRCFYRSYAIYWYIFTGFQRSVRSETSLQERCPDSSDDILIFLVKRQREKPCWPLHSVSLISQVSLKGKRSLVLGLLLGLWLRNWKQWFINLSVINQTIRSGVLTVVWTIEATPLSALPAGQDPDPPLWPWLGGKWWLPEDEIKIKLSKQPNTIATVWNPTPTVTADGMPPVSLAGKSHIYSSTVANESCNLSSQCFPSKLILDHLIGPAKLP